MGLDQYWLSREPGREFHYHRKVPALQDFMEQEYFAENPGAEEFNCRELIVNPEILDRLEVAIDADKLNKAAAGFFWGSHNEEDIPDIREAIAKARAEIAAGKQVIYTCWY